MFVTLDYYEKENVSEVTDKGISGSSKAIIGESKRLSFMTIKVSSWLVSQKHSTFL